MRWRINVREPLPFQWGGLFTADAQWSHADRVIGSWELMIGMEETAYMRVDDTNYALRRGDMLLIGPGERHGGYRISAPGVSFAWFHFDPVEPLRPDAGEQGESETMLVLPRHAACPNPQRVAILARQLLHVASAGYRFKGAADYFLTTLVIELAEQLHDSARSPQGPAYDPQMLEWIRLHALDRGISVARIAEQFRYNPDYLSRMFKRRHGEALHAYIHRLKLDKAKELLAQTPLGIKEIADRVGIGDDKQFMKWFKRLEGMTPTAYRKAFIRLHMNNR
ncbi:helix-turn-helix transcriptional regulator [Paenibacillus sp. IB182496]|uniref:Helix-turn-helix transcriptional regulator n=1 Tax=Paenibacillus sabuli TaxID=2772509 RepID=A0A927BV17_9BACL|nr:AraC family transcriptional regulator [Paenibacillus sabuli]MBD2847362.1 helix-turn-helix transcriptional regulator [Paenibacillus sabuli]